MIKFENKVVLNAQIYFLNYVCGIEYENSF